MNDTRAPSKAIERQRKKLRRTGRPKSEKKGRVNTMVTNPSDAVKLSDWCI